jgi:predicted O-linked N-acetylglucosamine transferase (SPINDLY family)
LLDLLGLTDFSAATPEQYMAIAVNAAKDVERLSRIRSELRSRFQATSIIGEKDACDRMAAQLRAIWQDRVAQASIQPTP